MRNRLFLIEDLNEKSIGKLEAGDRFDKVRVSRIGNSGDGEIAYYSVLPELGVQFTIFPRADVIRINEAYPLIVTGVRRGRVGIYTSVRCAVYHDLHVGDSVEVRVGREAKSKSKSHTFNIRGYLGFMIRNRANTEFYDYLRVGDPVRTRVIYIQPREDKSSYVGVVPLEKLVVPAS